MEEIYRNVEKIQALTIEKEKDVASANKVFEELRAIGLDLSDEMLSNLFHNPKKIINEAERQLNDEIKRGHKFYKSLKISSSLVNDVKAIVEQYKRERGYIIAKKGIAEISDDFYKMLEDRFVVKLDTPEKKKAYELANNVITEINKLESYMKEHGDGQVHGICTEAGMHNRCLIILSGNMDRWEWNPKIFPFVFNSIIK